MEWGAVQRYVTALVPERTGELRAMEDDGARTGFPIVGPAAGQACYILARLVRARRIFELGSGYGYSTAWFARAVRDNGGGEVFHNVWDEELSERARRHLAALGLAGLVRFHVGEAVEALRRATGEFDLVFNDIDKQDYPASLPVVESKLRAGGVLIVDNALWHGRVLDGDDGAAATRGVRELTRRLTSDPRWHVTLLPIRDGLLTAFRDPDAPQSSRM
jgi:caffeoyl-CoA O-methyltransferase